MRSDDDIEHHLHLLSFGIINFWVIRGIADLLKNGRFDRICSPYDKNLIISLRWFPLADLDVRPEVDVICSS
ncbi:hypothetical protein BDR04DRAFT_1098786 [Suillus decipiens]|nr:hypothetical protein BDR04DRAFT_1098786 [Suillus decipiens]